MNNIRLSLIVRGAVQGVGFRPFVYRLASELKLTGWVMNSAQGVFIEAEGSKEVLERFLLRVQREAPPRASIQSFESAFLDPAGFTSFEIRASDTSGPRSAFVLPDIAVCPECLSEIFDQRKSPLPVSVYELHQLRSALYHHQRASVRPSEHIDEKIHHVPGMPGGI